MIFLKFVFDLDGTLCFKGKPLRKDISAALTEATKSGHEVIFASARPIRDMLPIIDEAFHHCTMIGGNGSLIAQEGKVIQSAAFLPTEIEEIKALIQRYNATYLIDSDWNYAYTGPENHPIRQNIDSANLAEKVRLEALDPIVKILLLTSDSMLELDAELSKMAVYVNRHQKEEVLDISPHGVSKWSALRTLGIKEQTYIAFGNDANDISMFEHALYTVRIGDHEDLLSLATESISLSGDYEATVAKKIRLLVEENKRME